MIEYWKSILTLDNYQASNLGRIRSIDRTIFKSNQFGEHSYFKKGQLLKFHINKGGYQVVNINKKNFLVSRLVMYAFRGVKILPVDHRNRIKTDNRISNLRYLPHRHNCHAYQKQRKDKSSKFVGVSFDKRRSKWVAFISINNKTMNLGSFKTQLEASKKFKSKLLQL